jgi:hypothetical protein
LEVLDIINTLNPATATDSRSFKKHEHKCAILAQKSQAMQRIQAETLNTEAAGH